MLYLKLITGDFKNESRDKRELSAVESLGYKTLVVATTKEKKDFQDFYEGYAVYRVSTRRLGQVAWLNSLNRGLTLFYFVKKAIQTDADIISGHDYIATFAAYIANCFKRSKAKIVYDSHEFELYRNKPGRTEYQRKLIKRVEGFLLRRVNLSLMVGDKIADGVQRIYNLKERPTVVRNIPSYWELNSKKSAAIRTEFIHKLGLPEGSVLLMYHGNIVKGRGIECVIRALALLPRDIGFVVMGHDSCNGMVEEFENIAKELGVKKRVFFHPAVPVVELRDYIGAIDMEMILIERDFCRSYEYSLPNKFFETIQACVPMICSDLPEMGKIVREYDIGLLANENDRNSVVEAVLKLRNDKDLYMRLKQNMKKAKKELCWEKESLKLKEAIRKMMGEPIS